MSCGPGFSIVVIQPKAAKYSRDSRRSFPAPDMAGADVVVLKHENSWKWVMRSNREKNEGIVYSTDSGKVCPECGNPIRQCNCGRRSLLTPSDGIVRIGRETKGRKGSGVSIITGVPLDGNDLKKLARQLKKKCGTGGTIKSGTIEIQGDHRDLLKQELSKLGYTVKLSGG